MQETPVRFLGWEDPLEKGKLLTPVFGASVVSQLVKNPPAMWETWVQSLSWERFPWRREKLLIQYSGLENSMDCIFHGIPKSRTGLSEFHFHFHYMNTSLWLSICQWIFGVFFHTFFTMMNSPAIVSKLLSHTRTKKRFSTEISMNMII